MKIAKLFRNGGSQAVRIPKAWSFPGDSVRMIREPSGRIVIEPESMTMAEFSKLLGEKGGKDFPDLEPQPSMPETLKL